MSGPMLGEKTQESGVALVPKTRTVHKTFTAAATNNVAGLILAGDVVDAVFGHNDTTLTRGYDCGIAGATTRYGSQATLTDEDETDFTDYPATPAALGHVYPAATNVLITGSGGDLVVSEKVTFVSIVRVKSGTIGRKAAGM